MNPVGDITGENFGTFDPEKVQNLAGDIWSQNGPVLASNILLYIQWSCSLLAKAMAFPCWCPSVAGGLFLCGKKLTWGIWEESRQHPLGNLVIRAIRGPLFIRWLISLSWSNRPWLALRGPWSIWNSGPRSTTLSDAQRRERGYSSLSLVLSSLCAR